MKGGVLEGDADYLHMACVRWRENKNMLLGEGKQRGAERKERGGESIGKEEEEAEKL